MRHRTRGSRAAGRGTFTAWWTSGFVVLAVLAIAAIGGWWLSAVRDVQGGTARLVVDRETVDLGSLPFNAPARAVFTLTNAGNGALVIKDVPRVRAAQGC